MGKKKKGTQVMFTFIIFIIPQQTKPSSIRFIKYPSDPISTSNMSIKPISNKLHDCHRL